MWTNDQDSVYTVEMRKLLTIKITNVKFYNEYYVCY